MNVYWGILLNIMLLHNWSFERWILSREVYHSTNKCYQKLVSLLRFEWEANIFISTNFDLLDGRHPVIAIFIILRYILTCIDILGEENSFPNVVNRFQVCLRDHIQLCPYGRCHFSRRYSWSVYKLLGTWLCPHTRSFPFTRGYMCSASTWLVPWLYVILRELYPNWRSPHLIN